MNNESILSLTTPTSVGPWITAARKRKGVSMQAVASSVGVTRQAVWAWEHGTALPGLYNLLALAAFFNDSVSKPTVGQP